MKRLGKAVGLTLASGILAVGCTNATHENQNEARPETTDRCVASGYTEHFVGYWTLRMDGLKVASEDEAKAEEVLHTAYEQSTAIREQYPTGGYGGIQLIGALTHDQALGYDIDSSISDTLGKRLKEVQEHMLSIVHASSAVAGITDTGIKHTGPYHAIDASVPQPTAAAAYMQVTYEAPASINCTR